MRETVIFNNTVYVRYPETGRGPRSYFMTMQSTRSKQTYLHRDIWEAVNGPIPPGHHIHHLDGNRANNDISNLVCLSESQHHALHSKLMQDYLTSDEHLEHLEKIRAKAAEWHASTEGREYHREQALRCIHKPTEKQCLICGTVFVGTPAAKYCCDFCKNEGTKLSYYRIKDDPTHKKAKRNIKKVEKTCVICGEMFYGTPTSCLCSDECRRVRNNQYSQKARKP